MSIKALFQNAGTLLFDSFGDVIYSVTYTSVGTDIDPETEQRTGDSTETVRLALRTKKRATQGDIQGSSAFNPEGSDWFGELEGTILQSELSATPKQGDTVTMPDNRIYRVHEHTDVTGIVWKLRLGEV